MSQEELTDDQREELRALLHRLHEQLLETGAGKQTEAGVVTLDQSAVGRLSRIDAIQQQKMAEAELRRNALRVKQVAVAINGFEDDFGWCKRCGEPIGYRRLKARPETPCCVECMDALGR